MRRKKYSDLKKKREIGNKNFWTMKDRNSKTVSKLCILRDPEENTFNFSKTSFCFMIRN
jgi:hypothetical protein